MEKEDKELLLKDLCARLPYGVKVQYRNIVANIQYIEPDFGEICLAFPNNDYTVNITDVKPYLRSMSSMTEEEIHEFQDILGLEVEVEFGMIDIIDSSIHTFSFLELQALFDWLLKHHFDFMGLIEKDLAIAVTEENNPYKD